MTEQGILVTDCRHGQVHPMHVWGNAVLEAQAHLEPIAIGLSEGVDGEVDAAHGEDGAGVAARVEHCRQDNPYQEQARVQGSLFRPTGSKNIIVGGLVFQNTVAITPAGRMASLSTLSPGPKNRDAPSALVRGQHHDRITIARSLKGLAGRSRGLKRAAAAAAAAAESGTATDTTSAATEPVPLCPSMTHRREN
eukprot:3937075-Rhodomonas_salina.1